MIFTVEVKNIELPDRCEVELYLSREALNDLVQQLSFLKAEGDHAHFLTETWGGLPLTKVQQGKDTTLVNHMRITLVGNGSD